MLTLSYHTSAAAFLAQAQTFLLQAEIQHCVLLSAPMRLRDKPHANHTDAYFATIEQNGSAIAAAFCPPGKWLNLTPMSQDAIALVAADMQRHQATPAFVVAEAKTAHHFAQLWSTANGIHYREDYGLRIYQLEQVVSPRPVSGALRLATAQDEMLVKQWSAAFDVEVDYGDASAIQALMLAALQEQRLYLWDDSGPVSMLARNAPTPNSERVSVVYTPPEQRGKGYGAASNAALAQLILDSGKRYVCLFADMNNVISNKMYMHIGYEAVCHLHRYKFLNK